MNGVLIIDKPRGWTSHDVVMKVKGALRAGKVGHLGTLDPAATGVLPLVVNGATSFAIRLGSGSKTYAARLKLGEETDTCDADGSVIRSGDYSAVTPQMVCDALMSFTGRIKQTPPMYSAVKRGGVPLYKLARKGVIMEREPKEVEIEAIDIEKVAIPFVSFTMTCSKGTYVRSLCHDAGVRLGCGAHLAELRRTACGAFRIDEAVGPSEESLILKGRIIPLEEALLRASPATALAAV
ncbi:MAG: tRNA pseudouridine(55) synthase TruB [Deltaproteobacteria bacterium]|nr:tRNA pseudouridine(55) synthase TruB [Deltaproteobacteria bacterium]